MIKALNKKLITKYENCLRLSENKLIIFKSKNIPKKIVVISVFWRNNCSSLTLKRLNLFIGLNKAIVKNIINIEKAKSKRVNIISSVDISLVNFLVLN